MDNPSSSSLFDVYLRLRPSSVYSRERFLDIEKSESDSSAPTHITIKPPASDKRKRAVEKFAFTRVFEESAGQRDVYDGVEAANMVGGVLGGRGREGRDGLLATLGVTGSGKTHTILGSRSQRGLTQLTLDLLFSLAEPYLASIDASPSTFSSLCQSDVSEAQILSASTFLESVYGEPLAPSRANTPGFETSFLSNVHTTLGNKRLPPRPRPRITSLPDYPCIDDIAIDIDDTAEYAIIVSMHEVYNDKIFDLLTVPFSSTKVPQRRPILLYKCTEKSPDRKVVAGLRKIICSSLEEALIVLETGLKVRQTAGTGSNAVSSRSHGFFSMEVKKRRAPPKTGHHVPSPWTSSTLTIVDLAGSERARTANTAGATLAEAGKINESLMYLGQCMQMQADSATSVGSAPSMVPYRQCKLTELLFSNSFSTANHHRPQKAIMIVTADPLGDYNATSQILRYSALAREVTVPRIPSVTQQIPEAAGRPGTSHSNTHRGSAAQIEEELRLALEEVSRLRDELEATQMRLEEETRRRQEVETSWKAAESRIEEVEAEVREDVWSEMEARLAQEQRRWRAARDDELDRQDAHVDAKLDIFTRTIEVHEDGSADKENIEADSFPEKCGEKRHADTAKLAELEDENDRLRERLTEIERHKEREMQMRSPSKKMRVLKTRNWDAGSGVGLDCSP